MAFASSILSRQSSGSLTMVIGTYTNGGADTGGEVSTGLKAVEAFVMQPTGSAVIASAPVANESFPLNGGDVTVVNTADEDGIWIAYGRE